MKEGFCLSFCLFQWSMWMGNRASSVFTNT